MTNRSKSRGSSLVRKTPIKRGGRIKPNRKRKAANLLRAHGTVKCREWVKTLPCANCGVIGYSEGAHIKNGGLSRKASASAIVPLCKTRFVREDVRLERGRIGIYCKVIKGCHYQQHQRGWSVLPKLNTREKREAAAAKTQHQWLAFSGEVAV